MLLGHGPNPITAYLAHLSAVPLGIYKTGYSTSADTQASAFSRHSQHSQSADCGTEAAFHSTKSVEAEHFETPHGLKYSEEEGHNPQPLRTHLTFSSLSSAVHSGDASSQSKASCSSTARTDPVIDNISPDLWRKISRISALLQNVALSMSQARSSPESSRFMSRLSESNAASSKFYTSLGSFSTSTRDFDLKQIASMLSEVIDSSLQNGRSDGASPSDPELNREIDELVAQYNDMASLAISLGSEAPLISTATSVKQSSPE